jgi:AraC-like DNA-binding protein
MNKLCLWSDSALYIGDSMDPILHKHHAVQLCISLSGKFLLGIDNQINPIQCKAAIIGANTPHYISNNNGIICIVYLEKASNDYKWILDSHCNQVNCEIKKKPIPINKTFNPEKERIFLQLCNSKLTPKAANEIKQLFLNYFSEHISTPSLIDPRTTNLITYIQKNPEDSYKGVDLARKIFLSESRMQHLFKQQIGIPIRKYLLWNKIRSVLILSMKGKTLTQAAHQSGFSDSAHFSRTFKSMFGISPSTLLSNTSELQTYFYQ